MADSRGMSLRELGKRASVKCLRYGVSFAELYNIYERRLCVGNSFSRQLPPCSSTNIRRQDVMENFYVLLLVKTYYNVYLSTVYE